MSILSISMLTKALPQSKARKSLSIDLINNFGTPYEIISGVGGKEQYREAVKNLENQLYRSA